MTERLESALSLVQGGKLEKISFSPPVALRELLAFHSIPHDHPCGGLGSCALCRVRVEGEVSEPNVREREAGSRLSCQLQLLGDALCVLPEQNEPSDTVCVSLEPLAQHSGSTLRFGAAVDLGTTTIELILCELATGKTICMLKTLNPQRSFAHDLMGRLGAALEGYGAILQSLVLEKLRELLTQACSTTGIAMDSLESMVLTGNTAMLYLLTGRNPSNLARAPFAADHLFDHDIEVLGIPTYLPPCVSAFVGADFTCALLSSGLMRESSTQLLVDMGTNAEMALWKDGQLVVCSAAAGPCFEGVGISCGCSYAEGAVNTVWAQDGQLAYSVVGKGPARGLCGSGLIDAVAAGLDLGLLDAYGKLQESCLEICEGVELSQEDIGSFQLAKAAIAAGMQSLLDETDTAADEVSRLVLAGGFGSGLNADSAAVVGLFPSLPADCYEVIGNAALDGARALLIKPEARESLAAYASLARCIELGGKPRFNESYIEHMIFAPFDEIDW